MIAFPTEAAAKAYVEANAWGPVCVMIPAPDPNPVFGRVLALGIEYVPDFRVGKPWDLAWCWVRVTLLRQTA